MHPFGFRMPPPGADLRFPVTSAAASVSAAVAALTGGGPPNPVGGDSISPDPFALQRKLQEQQRLAMIGGASSNVYEIAALTQELDTMQLTLRVKDVLSSNNIGQKVKLCIHVTMKKVLLLFSFLSILARLYSVSRKAP